ncbi:MAG: PAS domain S-box protein [Candidatus Omnitrophota bacterium]
MADRYEDKKRLSESLINSSVDGILAFDKECHYMIWNPGMERISGISKDQALGKCAFDVFPFLKEIGEDKFFYDALAGKTVIAKDRPYTVPETGLEGFFEGHYSPLCDKSGVIVGGLAVIRDITERKKVEEETQKTLKELQQYKEMTVGREARMIELKEEVNKLSEELGRPKPYDTGL